MARNQILYYRQKTARDRLLFSQELMDQLADELASAHPPRSEYLDALESCMDELPESDRVLVRQQHEPGATNRSVSKVRGKSESTISRALDRIYRALLQCIRGKTARYPADGGVA